METETSKNTTIKKMVHDAINYRLLFNTKSDALESDILAPLQIKSLKDITSDQTYKDCFELLDSMVSEKYEVSLEELCQLYKDAISKYQKETWGKKDGERALRKEKRKKLALSLFEWAFIGLEPSDKAYLKSFQEYCPEPKGEQKTDVVFTLLITWDIIQSGASTRDYKDGALRNEKMSGLLKALREYLPPFGLFNNMPSIDFAIEKMEHDKENGIFPTSVEYWYLLYRIGTSLFLTASSEPNSNYGLDNYGLRLKGIWCDNEDNGLTRFWIFPKNYLSAFCFSKGENGDWTLHPYDFFTCTVDLTDENYDKDYCVWADTDFSKKRIVNPDARFDYGQIIYFRPILTTDLDGFFNKLRLNPMEDGLSIGLPWDEFYRITVDHPHYKDFVKVIDNVANIKIENKAQINIYNSVVAVDRVVDKERDKGFIYLVDMVRDMSDVKFILKHNDQEDSYSYCMDDTSASKMPTSLMDCMSNKLAGKLYRLSRKSGHQRGHLDKDRLARLDYAIKHLDLEEQVVFYHFRDDNADKDSKTIIFFNDHSVGMTVREAKDIWKLSSIQLKMLEK